MNIENFWARAVYIKQMKYNDILKLHETENALDHCILPFEIRQQFMLEREYELTQREHDILIEIINRHKPSNTSESRERMSDLDYTHSYDHAISHIKDNEWSSWRQATHHGKKAMAEEAE